MFDKVPRPVRLAEDTLTQEDINELKNWLGSSPQLTKGPRTIEFEAKFAEVVGAKFGVFVNSGSSANLLVAAALAQSENLKNNRVVCPAVSWVTTVTPFLQLGFEVELVEASRLDLGVDVDALEQLIIDFDPAILVLVHVLGHPNQMARIVELCDKYGVLIVEDSCEALGTKLPGGSWLGTIGDFGTFSFYYGHHISTIEGGMVVTDNEEFYNLMLSLRSHGWSRDLNIEKQSSLRETWQVDEFSNFYTFYYEGFNLRPTDLQAQLGMTQLPKIDAIAETRQSNYFAYKDNLPGFWSQASEVERLSSFAYGTFVRDRAGLARLLTENGVQSRPLICGNIGRHPFWRKRRKEFRAPIADLVHENGLYLPNHANLEINQIEDICNIIRQNAEPILP